MKPQPAFIGPQHRVELHAIAAIDLNLIFVIFPYNPELDDAFGDGADFEGCLVFWVFLKEGGVLEGGDEF